MLAAFFALENTRYWSIPFVRIFAMDIRRSTIYVGISEGTVTYHIFWKRPAPSTVAASKRDWSMPEIAAM